MIDSRLSKLQQDLLAAFFRREQRFFLTGGAELAGFHLGHRTTADLDLFTLEASLDEGERALRDSASELRASVENVQTSGEFRRRLVRRGSESVLVDLVIEHAPQGSALKPLHAGIRLDPPEEILANKLCTLLSRAEIRDLVDVMCLERAGYPMEKALPLAQQKDTGMSPAQLSWVLSEIQLGDDAVIPGGFDVRELRNFLEELKARLSRIAFPASGAAQPPKIRSQPIASSAASTSAWLSQPGRIER